MKLRISPYAATVLLAASLTAPLVMAQDHDGKRYYDKQHKDYHQWNDNEASQFTVFLNENHIKVHTWQHAKATEQQKYWQWRHDHPDGKR